MNTKPATIKQIAKLLAVSPSTVSRALHDHPSISLATKQEIKKVAAELTEIEIVQAIEAALLDHPSSKAASMVSKKLGHPQLLTNF